MLTEQQRRELDWEKTDGLMPVIVQHAAMSPSSRALNSDCGPKAKRRAIFSMW